MENPAGLQFPLVFGLIMLIIGYWVIWKTLEQTWQGVSVVLEINAHLDCKVGFGTWLMT